MLVFVGYDEDCGMIVLVDGDGDGDGGVTEKKLNSIYLVFCYYVADFWLSGMSY